MWANTHKTKVKTVRGTHCSGLSSLRVNNMQLQRGSKKKIQLGKTENSKLSEQAKRQRVNEKVSKD